MEHARRRADIDDNTRYDDRSCRDIEDDSACEADVGFRVGNLVPDVGHEDESHGSGICKKRNSKAHSEVALESDERVAEQTHSGSAECRDTVECRVPERGGYAGVPEKEKECHGACRLEQKCEFDSPGYCVSEIEFNGDCSRALRYLSFDLHVVVRHIVHQIRTDDHIAEASDLYAEENDYLAEDGVR